MEFSPDDNRIVAACKEDRTGRASQSASCFDHDRPLSSSDKYFAIVRSPTLSPSKLAGAKRSQPVALSL